MLHFTVAVPHRVSFVTDGSADSLVYNVNAVGGGGGGLAGQEPHGEVEQALHQAQQQRQVDDGHRAHAVTATDQHAVIKK